MDFKEKVWQEVRKIPRGRVTTYGAIGKKLHMSPRTVGLTLHLNPDAELTPCHRVVDRTGRVAPGYAFGGPGIQKKLLEREGVKFKDELHVVLEKHIYNL